MNALLNRLLFHFYWRWLPWQASPNEGNWGDTVRYLRYRGKREE